MGVEAPMAPMAPMATASPLVTPATQLGAAGAVPVAMPSAPGRGIDNVPLIDAQTAAVLSQTNVFTVQQKVRWLEAVSQGCFEQANKYTIFAGKDGVMTPIMIAEEDSDDCTRCFCKPTHSLLLRFTAVSPTGQKMFPVMTMEREGCTQCLGCEGKLCLGCFACSDQCQDGMKLHAGHVSGVPGQLGTHSLIGLAHQPKGGGGLTPTVQIMDRGSYDTPPLAVVQGPSIFGGCSECCCSVPFTVTRVPGGVGVDGYKSLQIGDLATITKKKPSGFGAAMRELFTDSDLYTLEIHDATVTPQQKASMLGSLLLLDYMFFEKDNDMIYCENQKLKINLCNCYCYGCLCPCEIVVPLQQG